MKNTSKSRRTTQRQVPNCYKQRVTSKTKCLPQRTLKSNFKQSQDKSRFSELKTKNSKPQSMKLKPNMRISKES